MRKITTIAAAFGLMLALSAPSFASTTTTQTYDLSAAKKKAKKVKTKMKKDEKSELSTTLLAAKKKSVRKMNCKKAPASRACQNKQS